MAICQVGFWAGAITEFGSVRLDYKDKRIVKEMGTHRVPGEVHCCVRGLHAANTPEKAAYFRNYLDEAQLFLVLVTKNIHYSPEGRFPYPGDPEKFCGSERFYAMDLGRITSPSIRSPWELPPKESYIHLYSELMHIVYQHGDDEDKKWLNKHRI